MGMFSTKPKETKEDKVRQYIEARGLTFLDEDLNTQVANVCSGLTGTKLINAGTTLAGKPEDIAKLAYLSAMVEQNWIIIQLLSDIRDNK